MHWGVNATDNDASSKAVWSKAPVHWGVKLKRNALE